MEWDGSPLRSVRVGDGVRPSSYSCSIARGRAEVAAAQRLRHEVMGEDFPGLAVRSPTGVEEDRHDEFAEHLVVRENVSAQIVGTYRMISPDAAARAGGLYAEGLFDLSALSAIRGQVLEFGRACVHRDHRNGAVINLLWRGVMAFAVRMDCGYLAGSPSIPLGDGGSTAAGVCDELGRTCLAPADLRVVPRIPWKADGVPGAAPLVVPPLVRAYVRAGGLVCGPPAYNAAFPSADFFMLLDVRTLAPRYARRYLDLEQGSGMA